jgi:GPH family glycoside/pentoside/hexuronide:cation symporter
METEHPGPSHSTPASQRVSIPHKIAYGAGGLSDFLLINFVNAMAVPIFAIALKMDPFLVAIAMAVPKVIGAFTDPLIGTWSDNIRTRWGRRRPFILVGGVAGVALLPLIWMPPFTSQTGMFLWLGGLLVLYAAAYSAFAVPYGALGYQLTTDYDERTRVLAWRGYIQIAGTLGAAWFYWFCLHPVFGNEVVGVRWLSLIVGVVAMVGVLATVLGPREKVHAVEQQPSIALLPALQLTFRNRPFMLLQAAILIIALGTGCEGLIGSYVHIYYTCQGSKEFASWISGLGGSLTVFSSFAALPLGLWISTHSGKRTAALAGIGISLLAVCLLPFTLVPQTPYLIIVSWVIMALGMPAASLMFGSITADITDEDELETGYRREGMYVAVAGFLGKIASIVTLLLGGWLPHLAGYGDTSAPPDQAQLGIMRWMLIGIQVVALAAAFLIIWFFPLTRARSEEVRRLLNERGRAKTPRPA